MILMQLVFCIYSHQYGCEINGAAQETFHVYRIGAVSAAACRLTTCAGAKIAPKKPVISVTGTVSLSLLIALGSAFCG
jgi:uncharacterized integral membrane protein